MPEISTKPFPSRRHCDAAVLYGLLLFSFDGVWGVRSQVFNPIAASYATNGSTPDLDRFAVFSPSLFTL